MARTWQAVRPIAWAVLGLLASDARLTAQPPGTAAHPGEYAPADIAYGARLYDAQCTTCHGATGDGVGAQGARVAPDLSDVGSIRSAASLLRSLTDPTSQMMPINRPVRAVTRDGVVVNGRRLNEDTYTVQILDDHERLVSLTKADLREFTVQTASPMPSYRNLSPDELADLVAHLLSLKGQ